MSCKVNLNSSLKLNCDPQQWIKAPSLDSNVKLAGEEAKDRLYEPKHKKKLVRVLTVVAYVFFVSLAAIMLSLYYVFLWNGHQKKTVPLHSKCRNDTSGAYLYDCYFIVVNCMLCLEMGLWID